MANLISNRAPQRYHVPDAFALARSLFGNDPFLTTPSRAKSQFSPHFEVREGENGYVITADVPGVKESDLDISLNGNVLTVSGSRKAEERKESDTYYLHERSYGSFSRSFSLPEEADREAIKADLNEGVLALTIGKRIESKPRKITFSK